jgi:Ribbon-helix-helix protein, copG family
MAQINITVDSNLASAVDRLASNKGISRPELLRQMMMEMIEAHDAGRLTFAHDDGPRLDTSLNTLAVQLREAVVELDRSQRENQKLTKRLIDSWNGGEEAAHIAQRQLTDKIKTHLGDGYAPFHEKVAELVSLMEAMPQDLSTGLSQRFGRVDAKLQSIENFAAEPRFIRNLVLGRDLVLEWKFLSIFIIIGLFIGSVFTVLIAGNIPPLARQMASRLVADTPQFCRTIATRYAVDDCAVPEPQRQHALKVIAQEDRP